MTRAEKEEKVRGIAERLSASTAAVLTDYRGLSVNEAAELRAALDQVDTRFTVVKNSLTLLAVKEAGLEGLAEFVDGPTAIAFILGDPVAGAKGLVDAARRLPVLEVRGGVAEGRILTADQIRELAALESREALLAKLAGLGRVQLTRTAWMLQALQSRFLAVLHALKDKLPEERSEPAGEAPAAETPAETETEPAPEPEAPAEEPEAPEPARQTPAETETEPSPEPEAPAAETPAETETEPSPEPEAPAEEPEAPEQTETEPAEGGA